jgi:hypothetical protein
MAPNPAGGRAAAPRRVPRPGRREIRQAGTASRDTLAAARAIAARRSEDRQMSVFTVDLKNRPGELARLCEALAGRGINRARLRIAHSQRRDRPEWPLLALTRIGPGGLLEIPG